MSTLTTISPLIMVALIWLPLRLTRPKDVRIRVRYAPGHIIGTDGQEL